MSVYRFFDRWRVTCARCGRFLGIHDSEERAAEVDRRHRCNTDRRTA